MVLPNLFYALRKIIVPILCYYCTDNCKAFQYKLPSPIQTLNKFLMLLLLKEKPPA